MFFQYDNSIVVYELRHFGKQRNSALPFIERSSYVNVSKHSRNSAESNFEVYNIYDIVPGFDLVFMSAEQTCLPVSLKQNHHCVTLRITAIDEGAKQEILRSIGDVSGHSHVLCKQMTAAEKVAYDAVLSVQVKCRSRLVDDSEKPLNVLKAVIDFCSKGSRLGYYQKEFYSNLLMVSSASKSIKSNFC